MPGLATPLKGTRGFRKAFLSTQREREALRTNENGSLFCTGLCERETQRAGGVERSFHSNIFHVIVGALLKICKILVYCGPYQCL